MSNQFYNYIVSTLIDYFKTTVVKPGNRYYLQLDNQKELSQLISSLREITNIQTFTYQHAQGEKYETFSIPFNGVKLVIAHTSENVTPDFLVTLRNLVGEQKEGWNQTALLSVVTEQLDSIQGGSSDLQKEGMPLHINSIFSNLKIKIENSGLEKVDQIILQDNLDNLIKEQSYQQITLFDFEDIFKTLERGSIEDQEYHKFGIFKDDDLATFKGKDQRNRLNENRELFDFVRRVHDFGLGDEELDKMFSPNGVKELKGSEWMTQPYSQVHKFHEEHKKLNKKKKVDLQTIKISDKLTLWNKPHKESSAGKRKRHLIIFNPDQLPEIKLQANFQFMGDIKSLSSEYLTVQNQFKSSCSTEVKKTNIEVSINTEKNNVTFTRFTYKHDKKASLGADFLVAVVPVEPICLDKFKSNYTIDPIQKVIGLQYEGDQVVLGQGFDKQTIEVEKDDQKVDISEDNQVTIKPLPEAFNDEDELKINLSFGEVHVPVLLKNELQESMPINGQRLWRLIREKGQDIQWIKENNRLVLENSEFYMHSEYKQYFHWEDTWVEEGMKFAKFDSDQLLQEDLKLSDDLREAYSRFITYFKTWNSIPSLSYVTPDYETRAKEYLSAYVNEIKGFRNGTPAGKRGMDLFKLGMVQSNEMVYLTPFHPLMVAFKLKFYDLLDSEEVDNSILNRLHPDALLPYIYDENENLYKSEHQQAALEWLTFKLVQNVSVSDANQFLAKVVSDKMSQFKEHFSYLFIEQSLAPLQLNIINIVNDHEVLKGILQWMVNVIEKEGIDYLKPIEVTLYRKDEADSAFDLFARTDSVAALVELFDIKLKHNDYDQEDVLRKIREKLFFYKKSDTTEYKYAHISFYKMKAQEKFAVQPMRDMDSGVAIEGLYSSVPSMKDEENYKSGFGVKSYTIEEDNYLTLTSYFVNELAANLRNSGNDSYRKGEAIFSRTTTTDEEDLEKIFKSSYWVTFVDPTIDLEYFNQYDGNLVVIHYSDQYSSSSRYDAITVTDKSNQYYAVIKEFLKQKEVEGTDQNVLSTIKAFNTFNGEWLLRIIGSKGHYDREKLSIISAIKFSVSYLDHPNILWVPISLEEVLRVAGAVSLNKSEGVFTAKNLGVKGSHSDDLLLIGLENNNNDLALHFYPVEVKIGINSGTVLEKAKIQVEKTKKLLLETLTGEVGDTFTGKFYRNFFAQLLISNSKKLEQSEFWNDKGYFLSSEIKEKLLKDQYTVSTKLDEFIGEGAILSFQKNVYHRSAVVDSNVLLLNLTEKDGYEGLVRPIKDLRDWIQEKENDFVKEDMLSTRYTSSISTSSPPESTSEPVALVDGKGEYEVVPEAVTKEIDGASVERKEQSEEVQEDSSNDLVEKSPEDSTAELDQGESTVPGYEVESEDQENASNGESTKESLDEDKPRSSVDLEDARILIGKPENSNRKIYWEYGNKGLANRHLLISGKSGQGKTYFMQCLLLEKSKLGIPSIVIDYTEGFLPNQLEPEFVDFLGDKLKHKIVYSEKLPINPFEKNVRDIGGIQLPESNTDVAERIKSVYSSVYKTLGIQQQNAIYEAILNGLERYDEGMSLIKLKELLEEDGSSYAKTALSQIRPLIDRNPFNNDNSLKWNDIIKSDGEVHIIQLTGFPRDVQLMITEFILWDLWNYSVRYGNKNQPMPVIMDEAQNLDHTEKSPSARILTEGRKFGWSAWYATQFLKSQLDAGELARLQNATQKVYFSPPEQELSNIASSLSKDPHEKKQWENALSSLKKGQCIVHGPVEKENGELSNPTINVVNIMSLNERI
ncbi:DNA phosphorothioation-dependent restriction protein DptH [Bacillus sp. AFS015802]|uniref:DNA phosphorothioation-dependent restriction protein DptH n=1 Tax=Bacillus sp. AFS015802 TaxID=2033486 RepID=UPI0015CF7C0B|nr:DNA phosphorothioation-dependent restriction protein DptH [Bacillus sp. AFS015802]